MSTASPSSISQPNKILHFSLTNGNIRFRGTHGECRLLQGYWQGRDSLKAPYVQATYLSHCPICPLQVFLMLVNTRASLTKKQESSLILLFLSLPTSSLSASCVGSAAKYSPDLHISPALLPPSYPALPLPCTALDIIRISSEGNIQTGKWLL